MESPTIAKSDGKGGPWATEVYALTSEEGRLVHVRGLLKFFKFMYF